jgi:GT2 family glycosyltransferase
MCAVIVLYRERAEASRTIATLAETFRVAPDLANELLVCIYDNSPEPEPIPDDLLPAEMLIFQPRVNGGLPPAYNKALEVARARGIPWLTLLDSDTEVSAEFLNASLRTANEIKASPQIVAIVPHVVEGGIAHSPRKMGWLRRPALPSSFSGVFPYELVALNSGATVRVSAMEAIGGFSSEFWLDYLDYWLFRVLQRKGLSVHVLREAVEHSLSLAKAATRMSVDRYRNMLEAEHYYTAKYGSAWERARLKLVLFSRVARFTVDPFSRPFLPFAIKHIFRWLPGRAPQPPHS